MSVDPWSVPVAVADVPEIGKRFDLTADERIRIALAGVAGVTEVLRLQAAFDVTRHGLNGLRVAGIVSATVKQYCVVTLEPLENQISESVDLIFAPEGAVLTKSDDEDDGALLDEEPEFLRDGMVDLGAVATEFLILGIDPYPRKPGSVFKPPQDQQDAANRPFAALAALKKATPKQEG